MAPPTTGGSPSILEPGTQAPAPQAKVSVWEDFIDIFHAPSAVFARREHGSVWIPLLVVTVLGGVLMLLAAGMLEPMMEAEFRRSMEETMRENPRLNAEAMQQMQGYGMMMAKFSGFVIVPIAILLIGFGLWIAGKIVGARQTLHAAFVVAAYAYMPRVLEVFLVNVQGLLVDTGAIDGRYRLQVGPARFLDPDTSSQLLLAIASRFDVFTLWVTALLAIGLAVTGRISRGQAAIAAALVWFVAGLWVIVPALG